MNELPSYYTILFQAVSQAVQALEGRDYGTAELLLVNGMQAAEEAWLKETDGPEA